MATLLAGSLGLATIPFRPWWERGRYFSCCRKAATTPAKAEQAPLAKQRRPYSWASGNWPEAARAESTVEKNKKEPTGAA